MMGGHQALRRMMPAASSVWRDAAHDHQDVPVRISIDGAWAQRVRRERHGIVISVVVGEHVAPRAGMDAVPDDLHQFGE